MNLTENPDWYKTSVKCRINSRNWLRNEGNDLGKTNSTNSPVIKTTKPHDEPNEPNPVDCKLTYGNNYSLSAHNYYFLILCILLGGLG